MRVPTWRFKALTLRKHSPIRRDKWLRANAEAIAQYNELVAKLCTSTPRKAKAAGAGGVRRSAARVR